MKFASRPLLSHTLTSAQKFLVERRGWLSRCGVAGCGSAPCRNRTYNLMIKSHFVDPASQRVRVSRYHRIATHGRQGNDTKFHNYTPGIVYNRKGCCVRCANARDGRG